MSEQVCQRRRVLLESILVVFTMSAVSLTAVAQDASKLKLWQEQRSQIVNDPDIVAYYDFQEGAGDVLRNQAKVNPELAGRIHGATWVEGRWPGKHALKFDGTSSYVEIPFSHSLILLDKAKGGKGETTMMVSFLPLAANECGIVDRQSTGWGREASYATWITSSKLFGAVGDGATGQSVRDSVRVVLNAWHHLVFTVDEDYLSLYKNGLLVDQTQRSIVPYDNGRPLLFGCMVPGKFHFNGLIDEVAIYRRTLKEREINLYSKTKSVTTFYIP